LIFFTAIYYELPATAFICSFLTCRLQSITIIQISSIPRKSSPANTACKGLSNDGILGVYYEGKPISKLQMDIELKQIRVLI
jgi:hypothetical protein